MSTLTALALIVLTQGESTPTDMARRSRPFFEKLIDFKIQDDLLVVLPAAGGAAEGMLDGAFGIFDNFSNVQISYGHGSSSTSRGGSGSVNIRYMPGEGGGTFDFRLESPAANETIHLKQEGGQLSLEFRKGKQTTSYVQAKGKCRLAIKAGGEGLLASRRTFMAAIEENPELAREYFLSVLEAYFDKVPAIRLGSAPPGKVVVHLRDGASLVGDLRLSEVKLRTAYGTLTLPRKEIRQILFPGAEGNEVAGPAKAGAELETIVVMQRFTPRGRLELEELDVAMPYGDLKVRIEDVRQVSFGPPVGAGTGDGAGTTTPAADDTGGAGAAAGGSAGAPDGGAR